MDDQKLLEDAEFDRIHNMTKEEYANLSEDMKQKYVSTRGYHFGQRQKIHMEGMMIDDVGVNDLKNSPEYLEYINSQEYKDLFGF